MTEVKQTIVMYLNRSNGVEDRCQVGVRTEVTVAAHDGVKVAAHKHCIG